MPFGNRKKYFKDLFSSVLSQFKKYHLSGNLKFIDLGIFQSLKFRISMEEILPISLKLNFTPNTLGDYGLRHAKYTCLNLYNIVAKMQAMKAYNRLFWH